MADQMHAAVVTRHGDGSVVSTQSQPVPSPGAGQVLVQVAASGINFRDVYLREGRYPHAVPFVLGDECAGPVVKVGEGVDDVRLGDIVATASSASGTHAQFALINATQAVPVPTEIAPDLAAAAMVQGMTAHYLVHSTYPVTDGDTVLIHAAAGGVGQLLVQMAKAQGAGVIGTVGSATKAELTAALGADHVLRTDETDDLAADVRAIVPDGVDVVYDGVGQATFEASLASLRRRGLLALFGAASGPVPPFDLQRLNPAGSLYVTRPTLGDYLTSRAELLDRAGDVLASVADGRLTIDIGGRYPLDDVRRAYGDLEGRRSVGKLLLIP